MRSWRSTELYLILAATPILGLLFAMFMISSGTEITPETLAVPIGLFIAFIASHFAICALAPNADNALLPLTYLLSGIGIIFVFRLAPDLATNQLIWLFTGVAMMVVTLILVRSINALSRYKYTIMLLGIILLLLPAVIGTEHYGSKIWLSIGGFSFQPSEIAKILIVIFLASYLAENREMLSVSSRRVLGIQIPDFKTLLPMIFMLVLSLLIVIFERDLGSALLFFGLFLVMIYVCTGRFGYVFVSVLLLAVAAVVMYFCFSHVQERIAIWLDPFAYAQDDGYQLVQALYSMADGGMIGVGIGEGLPTSIPVVESDFIFAAIAEEMGLLGAAGVLIAFLLFCIRGFATAARARRDVDAFAAVGLTASISFQAFVIVGGVTGLIPLTGVTLPFMSQGGSSLISSFIIVGLLLRTGDDAPGRSAELTSASHKHDVGILGRVALGKRITRMLTIFAVLFALLIANLTDIMVVRADEIKSLSTNNHTIAKSQRVERGSIFTSDGVVLAESIEQEDGSYERNYPQGDLAAHLLGYYSTQYGSTGLESSLNETLTGEQDFSTIQAAINSLAGISNPGNNVTLTINSEIQQAVEDALEGKVGAAVLLDPETGAVLAMASSPTYDVNDVASYLSGEVSSDALFNRATYGLYAPGSTFKTLTLALAIENGIATLDSTYDSPGTIDIGGGQISTINETDYGTISLVRAFAVSSNTVFAQIGTEIGSETLVSGAETFGFNSTIDTDFGITTSLMPDPDEMTLWETAWAAVGQPVGEHESPAGPQATVVQMAMVAAAMANDGQIMTPYVVDHISSPEGAIITSTSPSVYAQVVSAETAEQVSQAMAQVVSSGTGTAAQVSGAEVVGKTGTAQTSVEDDNSWFIGTATANGQSVTIAIVVEDSTSSVSSTVGSILQSALVALDAL